MAARRCRAVPAHRHRSVVYRVASSFRSVGPSSRTERSQRLMVAVAADAGSRTNRSKNKKWRFPHRPQATGTGVHGVCARAYVYVCFCLIARLQVTFDGCGDDHRAHEEMIFPCFSRAQRPERLLPQLRSAEPSASWRTHRRTQHWADTWLLDAICNG